MNTDEQKQINLPYRLSRYRPVNPGSLTIVLARYQEPTSWCHELSNVSADVQIVDKLQVLGVNKGNEETSYLHYILQHYDQLNDFTLFTHCEERAWHYKFRLPPQLGLEIMMMNLRGADPAQPFFWNINWPAWGRRVGFWGTLNHLVHYLKLISKDLKLVKDLYSSVRKDLFFYKHPIPYIANQKIFDGTRLVPLATFEVFLRHYIEPFCGDVFTNDHGQISFDFLTGQKTCACFVVSRASVLQHPRIFYEQLMQWSLDTSLESYWSGRFFEYVWHVIFGTRSMDP